MKKLLLILLCLPILSLAQVGAGGEEDGSYYYPSEESVSDGGAYYDGGITHVVPFAYNGHNYPDSIYADMFLSIFGSLTYSSSQKIESVFLNGFPLLEISLNYTYNPNNNKVNTFSLLSDGEGMHHSFIYDIDSNLIKKNTTVIPSGEEYKKVFTYSNGILTQMEYFLLPDTVTPIQTDTLTYNMSDQLDKVELSNGVEFEYKYNSVTTFCESVILFYNNNYIDTVITREYDGSGNMIRTSIKDFDLSASPPIFEDHRMMTYTYDIYNRNIKEEYWDVNTNQLDGDYADYIYFSLPTEVKEYNLDKELLKVTDLLGRETKQTNQPLFYIYDDGTVEKRIVIE
jgi:hypothetical protein